MTKIRILDMQLDLCAASYLTHPAGSGRWIVVLQKTK
jgi:hypothetical protein